MTWVFKYAVSMVLALVAIVCFVTIIGIPIGVAILAFIGWWIGKDVKRKDDIKRAARESGIVKQKLDDTIAVPEEELPWLI